MLQLGHTDDLKKILKKHVPINIYCPPVYKTQMLGLFTYDKNSSVGLQEISSLYPWSTITWWQREQQCKYARRRDL